MDGQIRCFLHSIYLSIHPYVHSLLHRFLPTSHLDVYESICREITRRSALGRSKLRPSRQSLDGKSPVLHKLESAGIEHRAPSLRQAPGTWEKRWKGPKVLHYFKACWAHDLRDHPSSIAAPYKSFSTFKLPVTPQLETPSSTWSCSLPEFPSYYSPPVL